MTDKKKPSSSDGRFKQVFYVECRDKPYTDAKIGEDDYLQTEVWKRLRKRRLQIDDYQCQKCGSGINCKVHHIHYPEVWGMESMDDLITLCDKCHAKVHEYDFREASYEDKQPF